MAESFLKGAVTLLSGDCVEVLRTLEESSIDSCVTDPPYGLQFMGKDWDKLWRNKTPKDRAYLKKHEGELTSAMRKLPDYTGNFRQMQKWHQAWAHEVLRVLKPGGHLLAFCGTRTYHRMAVAIEDAGFEVRDCILWLYGSGFPKSHDISKGIDRAAGAKRKVIKTRKAIDIRGDAWGSNNPKLKDGRSKFMEYEVTEPATEDAKKWAGWGTALKPSHEPVIIAQKPHSLQSVCDEIASKIQEGLCLLPSLVKDAERNSKLSQSVFGTDAKRASAQWNAVHKCNTPADLFALMDTSLLGSEIPTSLSIALSWLTILVEVLKTRSMFTTEMESSLIIELKILSALLSQSTHDFIIKAVMNQNGTEQNVSSVVAIFNAVAARLKSIHTLSAAKNASLKENVAAFFPHGLRPKAEIIILARKRLSEKTVAANVLKHGTGAINVDGCRIASDPNDPNIRNPLNNNSGKKSIFGIGGVGQSIGLGRWPSNVIHDGSPEAIAGFPESVSTRAVVTSKPGKIYAMGAGLPSHTGEYGFDDSGSAARYFYTAKANKDDRLSALHPTVKPVDLIQYLIRLVTPKYGLCLDPFAGTGTAGEAAWREDRKIILIERDKEYQTNIRKRMQVIKEGGYTRDIVKMAEAPTEVYPLFRDSVAEKPKVRRGRKIYGVYADQHDLTKSAAESRASFNKERKGNDNQSRGDVKKAGQRRARAGRS
jgi:DNA modification methylase